MLRRVGLAYFLAPLAALLVVWASMCVFASVGEPRPMTVDQAMFALSLVLVFGAPIAYLVTGIAGLPLARWLERRGQLRFGPLILLGMGVGAIVYGAFWAVLWSETMPDLPVVAAGGAAGGLAAVVFWAIAVHDRAAAEETE